MVSLQLYGGKLSKKGKIGLGVGIGLLVVAAIVVAVVFTHKNNSSTPPEISFNVGFISSNTSSASDSTALNTNTVSQTVVTTNTICPQQEMTYEESGCCPANLQDNFGICKPYIQSANECTGSDIFQNGGIYCNNQLSDEQKTEICNNNSSYCCLPINPNQITDDYGCTYINEENQEESVTKDMCTNMYSDGSFFCPSLIE